TFLGYHTVMPLRADLQRAGLRWVVPEAQHAIVFADGRPAMVIHRRDRLDRTRLSVGRYSPADADLLVTLLTRAAALKPAMAEFLTSAPSPAAAERYVAAIRRTYDGLPVLDRLGSRSAAALIRESFATPEVRTFLLMLAHELGGDITGAGGDIGFLGVVCGLIGDRAVPVGGMGSTVAAYQAIARRAGAVIQCGATVDRIIIAGGNAVGVATEQGHEVAAKRLVASTLPRERTLAMLGDSHRTPVGPGPADTDVVKQHLVLAEPPGFTSARGEPDVAQAVQVFFGWDDPRAVAERLSQIRLGALPAPGGALLRPALADPSQSRTPACLLAVDSTFPDLTLLTNREREAVQASFASATVRRLRDYAPNITDSAVTRSLVAPLAPVPRQVVINREGPTHYRAPGIGRLYLAGADSHPGGGIHGACGWNAASAAIADI
ncbi:MAG TPA: hypothetical protein VHF26_10415, partial [Trebonia sp.]|nr:hypothetical protein [Trebonia sp.]